MPRFDLSEFKRVSAYMRRTLEEVDQLLGRSPSHALDDVTGDVLDATEVIEDVLDADVIGSAPR